MKELEDREKEFLLIEYNIGLIIWSRSTWSEQMASYGGNNLNSYSRCEIPCFT